MARPLRFAPGTFASPHTPAPPVVADPLVALRNPYVRWAVASHGVPPWPTDFALWREGHRALTERVKAALRRFEEPGTTWADYERLAQERARWTTLYDWGRFAATASEGADRTLARRVLDEAERMRNDIDEHLKATAAYQTLVQWTRPGYRGLSASEKKRLNGDLETWEGGKAPKERRALRLTQEIRALEKRRTSAQERTKAIAQGVLVTDLKILKGMSQLQLDNAQQEAANRGQEGWLFLPGTWEAYHALAWTHDRQVREALWRQENDRGFSADASYGDHLLRLFAARHELADSKGCRSYAAYEMWGRAEESVRRMETFLAQGLRKMKPEARRAGRAMLAYMKQNHGLNHLEPWDVRYAENVWRYTRRPWNSMRRAFPWLSTIHKAVPELMAIGGWTVIERNDHGSPQAPVLHWAMRHHDGRKAHLWMDVFLHTDNDGAQSYPVRSSAMDAVTVVHMAYDRLFEGMDHENLITLAHELGHALHELATDPHAGHHDAAFPWDAVEVPSHLLQQYVCDHRVLRRWADLEAHPALKRSAYWHRRFRADPVALLDAQEMWYRAWLDLKVHSTPHPLDLVAFDRKSREEFGLPQGMTPFYADDRMVFNGAVWETYSAGFYAYPWADCLVHHLAGTSPDGCGDAGVVAQAFRVLQEHVLRRVGPLAFNTVWKQAHGTTAWQCALAGRDGYLDLLIERSRLARAE